MTTSESDAGEDDESEEEELSCAMTRFLFLEIERPVMTSLSYWNIPLFY